jgi:uncharacterized protein YbjQ (UPF0145 family)
MPFSFRLFILSLLTISLGGCSVYHVSSEDISTDYFPSKSSINDVVHMENINDQHEVIGYVTVNTERNQKVSEVIRRMKREAAIIGGDAITNIQTDATGTWKTLPAQEIIGNAFVRANFTATVIKFK